MVLGQTSEKYYRQQNINGLQFKKNNVIDLNNVYTTKACQGSHAVANKWQNIEDYSQKTFHDIRLNVG